MAAWSSIIIRRGGFSRAAATLHLSQPAISRRVHLLEGELGARLFDRVRSGATSRLGERRAAAISHRTPLYRPAARRSILRATLLEVAP